MNRQAQQAEIELTDKEIGDLAPGFSIDRRHEYIWTTFVKRSKQPGQDFKGRSRREADAQVTAAARSNQPC